MSKHFSFGECLFFFFQKVVDFFIRMVYNIGIAKKFSYKSEFLGIITYERQRRVN